MISTHKYNRLCPISQLSKHCKMKISKLIIKNQEFLEFRVEVTYTIIQWQRKLLIKTLQLLKLSMKDYQKFNNLQALNNNL